MSGTVIRKKLALSLTLIALAATALPALGQSSSSSSRHDRSSRYDHGSNRSDRYSRSSSSGSDSLGSPSTRPASAGGAPTTQSATYESYNIILTRNIFSKSRFYNAPTSDTAKPITITPQQAHVLTGILEPEGGGQPLAFIENSLTHTTALHRPGDTFANGKITAIGINSIEFTPDGGSPIHIDVGMNMEGGNSTFTAEGGSDPGSSSPGSSYTPPPFGAASSGSTSPGPSSGGSSADIIERLRQRRLQETKQ